MWKDVVFSDEFNCTLNNVSGMLRVCRETNEADNSDYFHQYLSILVQQCSGGKLAVVE